MHSPSSDLSRDNILAQFKQFKAHLTAINSASKECEDYIDMMGISGSRPKQDFDQTALDVLAACNPNASIEDLTSQLEKYKQELKKREESLQIDLAFLQKETGIEVKGPPSLLKNYQGAAQNGKTAHSNGAQSNGKTEHKEENKVNEKDTQKKRQELVQENQNIREEIIKFKGLLEDLGESTKELGEIITLDNKTEDLDLLTSTNTALRSQIELAAKLLASVGIEKEIQSLPRPDSGIVPEAELNKAFSKEEAKQDKVPGHWSQNKVGSILAQKTRVYKSLKPPVRDSKGEIILEKPVLFTLEGDIFTERTLRIDVTYYSGVPEPNKELGDPTKINETKAEITPYADKWRSTVRNLISRYELVDIDRGNYGRKRAIIKYRKLDETDDGKNGLFPVFSRAYFKLWEVLDITGILDKYKGKPINIASLAEGPGGFIHCMIDWRKKQNGSDWNKDSYSGITLRDQNGKLGHECIDWDSEVNFAYFDYVKKNHRVNLSYGKGRNGKVESATGDLLEKNNLEHFKYVDLEGKKCQLVTSDGGIHLEGDDSYSLQEVANIKLFFAETLYALHVQEKGGSFVMKIYDIYFEITVELILLLAFYYEKVTVFKPLTSRPANSEKYVIAEGFKGISEDHLERLDYIFFEEIFKEEKNRDYLKNDSFAQKIFDFDVDKEKLKKWRKDLAKGNEMQMNAQITAIEHGLSIASTENIDNQFLRRKRSEQKDSCIAWCKRHSVPYVEDYKI